MVMYLRPVLTAVDAIVPLIAKATHSGAIPVASNAMWAITEIANASGKRL